MIDFRYHLVSIVAVFLALAIGIVLGSTALQGTVLDGLRRTSDSLSSQLNSANTALHADSQAEGTDNAFLQNAEPALLKGMLAGTSLVFVTEPDAPSGVTSALQTAAKDAGATVTGTITLLPKFNDLSGGTQASLSTINSQQASFNGIALDPAAVNSETVYQQEAAQVIATGTLWKTVVPGATTPSPQSVLNAYRQGGYLTYTGAFGSRATAVIIVAPSATPDNSLADQEGEVLLALAGQFADASAATLVAGSTGTVPAGSDSPVAVLRNSGVSSQVSSVDDANTVIGQISSIWALTDQIEGGKPGSYGVSSSTPFVNPVPSPVPTATPTGTPTATKGTGKGKKTVSTKS